MTQLAEPVDVATSGGVTVITINRESRRNALNDAALLRMREALHESAPGAPVIITGAGTRAFCSGSDVKELATQTHEQQLQHTALGQALMQQLEEHPAPVIAAIEGHCLGGGLELALACDVRIAGAGANLGLPEIRLNALPTWGGTFRLARVVGVGRAKEVILLSRSFDAQQALSWGVVSEVVEARTALARARELAEELVQAGNGEALAHAKALITSGWGQPSSVASRLEYLADMAQTSTEAFQRGVTDFRR